MPSDPALPLMSIGVPVYNGERHLRVALDSALTQDYPNLEILISDNASTDGTEAIARHYARSDSRVRYWRNPVNVGAVKNFGHVLAEAGGTYFTWLACDDYLSSPHAMSKSVAFLEANRDVVLVSSDIHILDLIGPGILMPQRFPEIYPDQAVQDVRRVFYTWPQAIICFAIYGVYRREALAGLSFAGRQYRGQPVVTHMEWPVLLPLLERGRIVALPEFLRVYRSNLESSWFRESARLSGFDQFLLGLQMKSYLFKMAWRASLPGKEKLDILARTLRNFLVIGLRTERGEARRLREAADDRRQAIRSLRAEIDKRRDLLRQHGCGVPIEPWPTTDMAYQGEASSQPGRRSRWRAPGWFEPLRDAATALATDFFWPRSAAQQIAWRKDIVDSWTLRPLCEELLQEILRLTAEAERCSAQLNALQSGNCQVSARTEVVDESTHGRHCYADSYHELQLLGQLLSPGSTWLDVACGTGYFLRHFPQVERAGIDLSPALLNLARQTNPGIDLRVHDLRHPIETWVERWDVVSCMRYAYGLVSSISDLRKLIENLACWTSPHGTCFVPLADLRLAAGLDLPYEVSSPNADQVMSTEIMRNYVEDGGHKVYAHQIAPNPEFMIAEFQRYFDDVCIVRYPCLRAGWQGRPALLATRKKASASASRTFPLDATRPPRGMPVPAAVQPHREARPLVFLHIPKTAGTSVVGMISQRFPEACCNPGIGRTFRDPGDTDFVFGHLDLSAVQGFTRAPILLTFLRDPLERAVSMWRYFRSQPVERLGDMAPLHPVLRSLTREFLRRSQELTLVELLEQEPELARMFLGNMQTAFLMGWDFDHVPPVPTSDTDVCRARSNLKQFDVIGITEDFDRSMDWLALRMGWGAFGPGWIRNVLSQPGGDSELAPRAKEILTEWNRLDLELYGYGRQLAAERRESCSPRPCAALPTAAGYRFDGPIHGDGWHERERGPHGWFCWTGQSPESFLDFASPRRATDHRLVICVPHVIRMDALEGLQLWANEVCIGIEIHSSGGEYLAQGLVPARALTADKDRLRLWFRPGVTLRPCDLGIGSHDTRPLGIAVRQIDLVEL